MIGVGEPLQAQVDVETAQPQDSGMDVTAPLLPVAMKAPDADTDDDGEGCCEIGGGCCQIAICGGSISNGGTSTDPDTPTSSSPPALVDAHAGWATAFKLTVALTFVTAVWTGGLAAEALANGSLSGEGRRRLMHHSHGGHHSHHHEDSGVSEDEEDGGAHLSNFIVGGAAFLGIASLVSAGMLHSLFHCGRSFLGRSYAVFVGLFAVIATALLAAGAVGASVFFFAIFALGLVVLRRRKKRIAFGSANLKVASVAIKSMPWTYLSAILMGLVQFGWCVVAAIAALGSFIALETVTAPDGSSYRAITCLDNLDLGKVGEASLAEEVSCSCNGVKISDEECHFSGFGLPLTVVWLCVMAWGCGVIKNVVACTVSGSIASWWFSPTEDTTPVKGAFHRATTSSFGSLCKAAAVQKFVATVCQVAEGVLRVVPCASTLLPWANKAADYAITYIIAFVGIYGLSFNEAGGRVREMFKRRTVTTLANDIVVGFGLGLLAVSAFAVYALVTATMTFGAFMKVGGGALFDDAQDSSGVVDSVEFWSVVGPLVFGVVALFFLNSTVLEVVRSGVKAVFVCFVQDPEMLAEKHGQEMHAELNTAWESMHTQTTN